MTLVQAIAKIYPVQPLVILIYIATNTYCFEPFSRDLEEASLRMFGDL